MNPIKSIDELEVNSTICWKSRYYTEIWYVFSLVSIEPKKYKAMCLFDDDERPFAVGEIIELVDLIFEPHSLKNYGWYAI